MSDDPAPDGEPPLAAEYVLGLLDEAEMRAATARLAGDPDFARDVRFWQDQLVAAFDGAAQAPRPSLWADIKGRIADNDPLPALSRSVRRWQLATGISTVAAALLAAVLVSAPRPDPAAPHVASPIARAPAFVAILTGTAGENATVVITYDKASNRLLSAPVRLEADGRFAELWVIPADQKPRSLGLIGSAQAGWAKSPAALAAFLTPDTTLAVSLEPRGGSPSGLPTGPVVVTGHLKPI